MAEIIFETDNFTVEASDNSAISDVADEKDASLPFGCREGQCGTCRVIVIEGMENLNDIENEEKLILDEEELGQGFRLGCQLIIKSGRVVLKNG